MASLYKRANPVQRRIIRIVEGAVHNTSDAHDLECDEFFARSVAKRACGVLSAQLAEVLTATTPPKKASRFTIRKRCRAHLKQPHCLMAGTYCLESTRNGNGKGPQTGEVPFPTRLLIKQISMQLKEIKSTGNMEKANAFIEVLRMIDNLKSK